MKFIWWRLLGWEIIFILTLPFHRFRSLQSPWQPQKGDISFSLGITRSKCLILLRRKRENLPPTRRATHFNKAQNNILTSHTRAFHASLPSACLRKSATRESWQKYYVNFPTNLKSTGLVGKCSVCFRREIWFMEWLGWKTWVLPCVVKHHQPCRSFWQFVCA